jgi:hypothetical protein
MVTHVKDVVFPCPTAARPSGVKPAPQDDGPAVLLVEHRDEVYARLAADFAETGLTVVRATTAFQAIGLFARHNYDLVVANLDLLDQSGWLLAGKLHFIQESVCIWLYKPQKTPTDVSMAKFLRVDELLEYGGDLLCLSDAILDCLAGKPVCQRRPLSGHKPRSKALAAA